MTQCFLILSVLFSFDFVFIGHCQKYHYNYAQNCHLGSTSCVNLTFALSSVHNLHVQFRSVCQKFAHSANLGKCSTLAKVYVVVNFLSFIMFRSLATREMSWKVYLIKQKVTGSSASQLLYVP